MDATLLAKNWTEVYNTLGDKIIKESYNFIGPEIFGLKLENWIFPGIQFTQDDRRHLEYTVYAGWYKVFSSSIFNNF